jgi:hypothetical protein
MSAKRLKMGKAALRNATKDNDANELKLETFGVGFKMASKKASEEPSEFASIPLLAGNIIKADWKSRIEIIDKLTNIAERNVEALQKSTKLVPVLESLIKCLSDSNGKVSFKAVNAFEKLIPLFKTGIEHNINLLLEGISNNLCSTNTILKNKSEMLLDLVIDTVESECLVQPLVHIALYGNARARATIIAHLCGTLIILK